MISFLQALVKILQKQNYEEMNFLTLQFLTAHLDMIQINDPNFDVDEMQVFKSHVIRKNSILLWQKILDTLTIFAFSKNH